LIRLKSKTEARWTEDKDRRRFFDEFARIKQFDPLDAEAWYSITRDEIRKADVFVILPNE
jgi:hypothetical protein